MRPIRILTLLAALALAALTAWVAWAFVFQPSPVVRAGKGKGLAQDQMISGQAGAREFGVRKGDAFPFLLELLYDPAQVAGIDRVSLDKSIDVKPFEIRSYRETDSVVDARTRVYRREYVLQLVEGQVDHSYQLSTMIVRYALQNANGFAEKAIVPEPVVVAAWLPQDTGDLELRPITDKVADPSRDRLIGVLWMFGALLVIGAAADLSLRVMPQWRKQVRQGKPTNGGAVVAEAYRSLAQQVAQQAEPRVLLHQMDHLLRLVLVQKAKLDWLSEPNLDQISHEIRPVVAGLLAQCQQAYGRSGVGPGAMDETMRQLDQVLQFYYGAGAVEAWWN